MADSSGQAGCAFLMMLAVVGLYAAGTCGPESPSQPRAPALPAHRITENQSIEPRVGRRIHLESSDPALSRDGCRQLIDAYRDQAGPDGLIAVAKPDKDGDRLPWCVENFDGAGVTFQDYLFQ